MYNRVLNLIITRLVIVLLLFCLAVVAGAAWRVPFDLKPMVLFSSTVCALSLGYYVFLRTSKRYLLQTYIQIFTDVLLTTWLIYLMRESYFSLVPLYLVIVLGAGMVLPRPGVIAAGLFCVACYAGLAFLFYAGILEGESDLSGILQPTTLPLYTLALLVLTILGGQLAERLHRSDTELETATRYLADLRAFNERIVQSINSGLVTTDLSGTILSFNRAAEEITKYQAARVRGRHFYDVFGDLSSFELFENSEKPIKTKRFPRFDVDCRSQDERAVHLGFSASPLVTEAGDISGYVFSFQDLTEILKLEQEVRRRDRLAALGKMAAGIAHEIRNPLAAMRGSVQLLRSEMELNEDQEHLMQIVLRESDRLNRIINDFLAYARPSPSHPAKVDVVALVEDTFLLLKNSPEVLPGHQFVLQAVERPLHFVIDPNQMRQVFWNLCRNALQAMPQGGSLDIGLKNLAGNELEIKLRDTGMGMSEEQMERMFEPFNSSRSGGTGLGMAIVYQIISDHRGTISIVSSTESVENTSPGTEITIRLPAQDLQ